MKIDILPGISLYNNAFPNHAQLYDQLMAELELQQKHYRLAHGLVPMPRLTAFYGDPGTNYSYSGIKEIPLPWTPNLAQLRDRLNVRLRAKLNSVLCNHYRHGRDSVNWHADAEPELHDRVVSVSLGAPRTFLLREGRTGQAQPTVLTGGSVLVMTIASQQIYQHSIPKETAAGPRLNLTFRTVRH